MSAMSEFTTRAAVDSIRAAFSSSVHPGTSQLLAAQYTDDGLDLVNAFGARHWSELQVRELFENRDGIWSLTPAGYRFYLPAFMIEALSGAPESGDIGDAVLASLRPGDDEQRFRDRISLLTAPERDSIRAFLEAIRASEGAWNRDPSTSPSGYWFSSP